jgi:preprotein translocase subunit SecF
VFDRIRENLKRYTHSFDIIVNDSIVETVARSLSTSITVLFTLLALLIFGGESIRLFVLALLLGVLLGTYSSIFNAAPMLVVWNNYKLKRQAKKKSRPTTVKPKKA